MEIAKILYSIFRAMAAVRPPVSVAMASSWGSPRVRYTHLKSVFSLFAIVYGMKVENPFRDPGFRRSKPRIAILDLRYLFRCEDRHPCLSDPMASADFGLPMARDYCGSCNGFLSLFLDDLVLVKSSRASTASSSHSPRWSRPLSATQSYVLHYCRRA